jgi:cell division protein FtsB
MMIEILLLLLGVVVGYNIRHERRLREESLVLEEVDARLRKELAIAKNLNDSLQQDVAELKSKLAALKSQNA